MYRILILLPLALLAGCGPSSPTPIKVEVEPAKQRESVPVPAVRFKDVTDAAGIRFTHANGSFGKKLLPETMGAGVAVLDFNKDGKPDLLFVNSCPWPGHEEPGVKKPTLALYRNDSVNGQIKYTDVTEASGLAVTMYGMGATVGDFDNDGWPDVFVTGVGGNRLFHNEDDGKGGRRFVDVTDKAGVAGPGGWPAGTPNILEHNKPINWSTSAAWLDYDGDGKLDLFVCNYVVWSPKYDLDLESSLKGAKDRAFGPPIAFPGSQCFLYRNLGGGKFEDVSEKAGVHVFDVQGVGGVAKQLAVAKSLGVIVADVDNDGWPDIIVANDTVRNFFFHNNGDGTFTEKGLPCGVAYAEGRARGAMGADYGEFKPGRWAVLIGNFADEPDTFLCLDQPRPPMFSDGALREGLWGPSRTLLKFGVFFFDYDLDGRLDLLTCNGHLEPQIAEVQPGQRFAQPPQLFWNSGGKQRFEPVPAAAAGDDLFKPLVGRGCAYLDADGNGTLDVVLTANGGPARLLRNEGGTGNHWLRLALEGDGVRSNRSAIGARVTVEAGGLTQQREVASARGYLSQSETVLTFGLGGTTKVDRVTVRWPGKDGGTQVLTDLKVDQLHAVTQKK